MTVKPSAWFTGTAEIFREVARLTRELGVRTLEVRARMEDYADLEKRFLVLVKGLTETRAETAVLREALTEMLDEVRALNMNLDYKAQVRLEKAYAALSPGPAQEYLSYVRALERIAALANEAGEASSPDHFDATMEEIWEALSALGPFLHHALGNRQSDTGIGPKQSRG